MRSKAEDLRGSIGSFGRATAAGGGFHRGREDSNRGFAHGCARFAKLGFVHATKPPALDSRFAHEASLLP